ncbi:MAG: 4Fe-4S binding protein [Spirochaetales bacterium]|nr:4Fe-4S binding protein [Spirochaetales bacterium]
MLRHETSKLWGIVLWLDMIKSPDVYKELRARIDRHAIPFPETSSGVELRLLRAVFDEEEARVACALGAIGEPLRKIMPRLKKLTYTEPEVVAMLDRLAVKGAIHRGMVKSGNGRERAYSLLPIAVGMFEMQVDRLTEEYAKDFDEYLTDGFSEAFYTPRTHQLRTVPVGKALKSEKSVGAYDDIRAYIESIKGPFAVMNCVCRQAKELRGGSCDHGDARETCLTVGAAAVGMSRRGNARLIKKAEIIQILERAEKKGFVLQPENTQNPDYICCCCSDCCEIITTAKKLPSPGQVFTSDYYCVNETDQCTACGRCVKRCPMDAITLDNAAVVEKNRCIGCGLCVSTCPEESLSLVRNKGRKLPPKNKVFLYGRIFKERFGLFRTAAALIRHVAGGRI